MKISRRMYEAVRPVWEKCLKHPFVVGLGDGTLPVEKFQYYMLQDYLYLFEYAKVFALGVVKAQDYALMHMFARNMEVVLNGEMNLHRAYMTRLGIEEAQVLAVRPALDNISYTNYMLSVAHAGGPAEIAAAILSCSWSYAEIGRALAQIPGAMENPFYGEWISGYSSKEYEENNDRLVRLTDDLAKDLSAEQQRRLVDIFVNSSRYELGFWDMAWEMRS